MGFKIKNSGHFATFYKICLVIFVFHSCTNPPKVNDIDPGLYNSFNGNISLNFKNDTALVMRIDGAFFEAHYSTSKNNNLDLIEIIFDDNGDTLVAEYFIEEDKSIYLKYYKMQKGIEHHIDEIVTLYPYSHSSYEAFNCSAIVLDTICEGEYLIHFENELTFSSTSCDTLHILQQELTRTAAGICIKDFENLNILNSQGVSCKPCNSSNNYSGYCIEYFGFNIRPRKRIENSLNQNLPGDLLMFKVKSIVD